MGSYSLSFILPGLPSARLLADAWAVFIPEYKEEYEDRYTPQDKKRLRLEVIYPGDAGLFWLVEQLSRPEVGIASVYARVDEPSTSVGWHWPLKVGLLSDQKSVELYQALRSLQRDVDWIARLFELIKLSPKQETCDLLLIPNDIRAALASRLQSTSSIKADCVIILERAKESPQRVFPLLAALRSQIRTSGIGLAYVPSKDIAQWFSEVIRELSHNDPIDVALYRACRRMKTRPPLLVAARRLADFSRISKSIKALGEQLINAGASDQLIEITSDNSINLNLPTGNFPPEIIGERLRDGVSDFPFDSERRMATTAADLADRARGVLEAAPVPEPQARRILTQVFDLSIPGENRRVERALRINAPHVAVVRIGTESEGWIPADISFPDTELPANEDEHKLTVVFSEPRLLPEPQTATILLPRVGDSSECKFYFHTHEGITQVEARIIILHRNRVLQTALLRAPVIAEPSDAPDNSKVELLIEATIRPGMQDLDYRRRFDAALVLNHDAKRVPGIAAIADNHASFYSQPELDKEIRFFDGALSGIADDPEKYSGGLTAAATVELLRDFAQHGSLLYESIVDDKIANDAIAHAQRIQIISAEPEARLPVEFFYDRKAPRHDAVLCPQAATALESGHCAGTCPAGDDQSSVVCPLGFWGMTRVIERHTHSKEFTKASINGDFRFQAEPVSTRQYLNVLSSALMAASDRVDKKSPGGVASVQSVLETVTKKTPRLARSWEEWITGINAESPSILVLLPHTAVASNTLQELEISDGADGTQLLVSELEPRYVRDPNSNPPPLVLLIGCETGAPDITFLGFVTKFRRIGAAIVVSTGATILGRHAAPVAREFVNQLSQQVSGGGVSFGDIMLTVRRKLLAQGLPMVFCLMSYGDADWQLRSTNS
jgi:hypothetical protein